MTTPRPHRLLAPPRPGRSGALLYALRTTNPPPDRPIASLDGVTRWVVVTRAAVLPMTLGAGLVAGALAARADGFRLELLVLAVVGIVAAHTANNLMNDLADTQVGLDTAGYPRALYAPHPTLSGLVTRRQLLTAVLGIQVLDLAIMVVLATQRGWPVVAFALGGLALSWAYTAPPLRLKARGLGEPDVFLTWGPLMVAGTYFSAVGQLPWQVWVASVPYGLLCTTVLMGKHIDKIPWDAPTGTRTLPVLLGEQRARAATRGLLVAFYASTVVAVALGALPWPALLVLVVVPTLTKVLGALRAPRPEAPPEGFPVWPLWFAAICFVHTVRAGAALVGGLLLAVVLDVGPPLGGPVPLAEVWLSVLVVAGVLGLALLALGGLTVVPCVVAVSLAQARGASTGRWGLLSVLGVVAGLGGAGAVVMTGAPVALAALALLLVGVVPALAAVPSVVARGPRAGLHEAGTPPVARGPRAGLHEAGTPPRV